MEMEPIVADILHSFPYELDRAIRWKYGGEAITSSEHALEVSNVAGVSRITRSGRVYGPLETEKNPITVYKGKKKVDGPTIPEIGKEGSSMDELRDGQDISNEQPNEFLKFIKQREYKVIDHLSGIVNNIVADNFISLSDQEIPCDGNVHINPLHISVTLFRLPINYSHMRTSAMIVKAFDCSKREVMGESELPIKNWPCTFQIPFQVMDINLTYNCLLGRPWIHAAGVVPSTLHQWIKFIINGQLLIIMGEEDMLEVSPELLRFVEHDGREIEPHDELIELVNRGTEDDKKVIKVCTLMHPSETNMLIKLLHEYKDHKLPLKGESLPVNQKLRRMKPNLSLRVKDEIPKWLTSGFIKVSKYPEGACGNLPKLIKRLRDYTLKLKPAKCSFQVQPGRVLNFIVSQKGIEVDPEKVKAITEMPPHRTKNEVRGFLGRLNYISRFISEMKNVKRLLKKIKQYLLKPPVLMLPVHGRPLIMYLTILDDSMGCVLTQHDKYGKKERAIYYLKHIFEKPMLTGKMTRWHVLFLEYDIVYVTQKAIKGSLLADYLANQPMEGHGSMHQEFSFEGIMPLSSIDPEEENKRMLVFDRASNVFGHEVGAILVFEDSTIVIHQVKGKWETRDSKLIPYRDHMQRLVEQFVHINFYHIRIEDNWLADTLSTLILRRLATSLFLNEEVLYKRNHDLVLLRRVEAKEVETILKDVHKGSFGTHANGHAMAKKILRACYYLRSKIITDNATNLNNKLMEAANKNINKIVQKMVVAYKDWNEMLPFALHR
uniref:RNase H type-1 domain-containing protein n=1 Tax=Lupinus angustifolius TaxID=3871 RepID=A0A3S5X5R9_LUPAN|nr:hypothetical protein [Lupinus angustifolius]